MNTITTVVPVCLALGAMFGGSWAYPTGPPVDWTNASSLCIDMIPEHGVEPKTTAAPFDFTYEPACFNPEDSVKVMITNSSSTYFEGFFVQARKPSVTDSNVGTFTVDKEDSQSKTLPCFDIAKSAIGHKEKFHYMTRTVWWNAPSEQLDHDIVFEATIVHETDEYWVGVKSSILKRCEVNGSPTVQAQAFVLLAAIAFCKMF